MFFKEKLPLLLVYMINSNELFSNEILYEKSYLNLHSSHVMWKVQVYQLSSSFCKNLPVLLMHLEPNMREDPVRGALSYNWKHHIWKLGLKMKKKCDDIWFSQVYFDIFQFALQIQINFSHRYNSFKQWESWFGVAR